MTSRWYCLECEREIDADAIEDHEADGHAVKGTIQPDRLLRNDPWNMGIEGDAQARAEADLPEEADVADGPRGDPRDDPKT